MTSIVSIDDPSRNEIVAECGEMMLGFFENLQYCCNYGVIAQQNPHEIGIWGMWVNRLILVQISFV